MSATVDLLLGTEPLAIPSRRDTVRALWEAGRTQREIAAALRIGLHTIGSDMRIMGLRREGNKRRGGLEAQFMAFVQPEPNSGCWLWDGSADTRGYGQIRVTGKRLRYASHVSLELAGRAVPPGMCACHRCDNPGCVNPDHLFVGTRSDNTQDMIRKGRASSPPLRRGSANCRAVIDEAKATEIKRRLADGEVAYALAHDLGVKPNVVYAIKRGETWRYV